MDKEVFLLLLLGHLLADFPFQGNSIIDERHNEKEEIRFKGNLKHSGIHLITYFVLLLLFNYISLLTICIIIPISFVHFLIDIFKSELSLKNNLKKYTVLIFLCDQSIHIFFIIFLACFFVPISPVPDSSIFKQIYIFIGSCTYSQKLLIACVLMIAGLWGTGIFANILIQYLEWNFKRKDNNGTIIKEDEGSYNKELGFIIGILERLFIIFVIIFKMPSWIAFAEGLKAIARFKEFDKGWFVQIFIIGSFFSLVIAIVVGIAISGLNLFPWITGSL